MVDDDHEMISWGYSNITPWHSHREMTEEELGATLRGLAGQLQARRTRDLQPPCPAVSGAGSTTRRSSTRT